MPHHQHMTSRPIAFKTGLWALLLVLGCASLSSAREPTDTAARIDGRVEIMPNGDGHAILTMDVNHAPYTQLKRAYPNPQQLMRDFTAGRSNWEIAPGATAEYDDRASAVHLKMTERGGIVNRGNGRWTLEIDPASDFVAQTANDGRITMHFYEVGSWGPGVNYRGPVRYQLPEGAKDALWNERSRELTYTLPRDLGSGPASLSVDLQTKQRIMSAVYKVYGFGADFSGMWIAKGVIENTGKSLIKDLKVRYKLGEYSEWSTWQRFPELVPSQMVRCNYYPVLKSQIARLTSNTPADVRMEWSYRDIDGQQHEDSSGERITILGGHEFVFSNLTQGESTGTWHESFNNAPLVAAWASRDDMVVKQFAAMANKMAGGVGASSSNDNAVKVLRTLYDIMRVNDFTYQHPPGMVDKSLSFDVQMIQNVKFPRDVIRDRSGTCIDLAILYASMANAVGLKPFLAFIPGHCFPVIELPGGQRIGVEVTGIGGGLKHGSDSFAEVVDTGIKTLAKWQQDGRIYVIDVQEMWTRGIANPELPRLPPNILNDWKIKAELPRRPDQPKQPDPQQPRNAPPFVGIWGGNVTEALDTGGSITYPVVIQIQRGQNGGYTLQAVSQARVPTANGPMNVRIEQTYAGQLRGSQLVFKGTSKVATANGQKKQMPPDNGVAQIVNGTLQGRAGNDNDGYENFQFQRQRR